MGTGRIINGRREIEVVSGKVDLINYLKCLTLIPNFVKVEIRTRATVKSHFTITAAVMSGIIETFDSRYINSKGAVIKEE